MNDDRSVIPINEQVRDLRDAYNYEPVLKPGGGGGNSGGMDERLTRLEGQFDRLRDDNTRIREQLATLTEKVAHLPGKSYIDVRLAGLLGLIALLITFGEKLQALVN